MEMIPIVCTKRRCKIVRIGLVILLWHLLFLVWIFLTVSTLSTSRHHLQKHHQHIFFTFKGRIWGSRIVSEFKAGVSGWIYWNLLLDMNGGPFEYSPEHADNGKNFQQAMFHVNAQTQTYHPTALFWYVAHFSKFVRPDSVRVDASLEGNPRWQSDPSMPEGTTGIELLAFESHDKKSTVLQILNHWNVSTTIFLRYLDLETSLDLPAISITTAIWKS